MSEKAIGKQIIDMEKWDRQEAFYIFKTFDMPFTNLCSDIEITNFMRFIRLNDYHFFGSLLFYVIKTANVIKEFRCRLEGDTPVIWDSVGAGFTLMQDSGIMGSNYTDFTDDFNVFYKECMQDIEVGKRSGHMSNKMLPGDNVVHITSIPWLRLTNFMQAVHKKDVAIPYIGIGRRYGEGEHIKLSVAVQAHHAFIDGFHISHFFMLLEKLLSDPEKYMTDAVPYETLLKESRPFILSEKEKPFYTY